VVLVLAAGAIWLAYGAARYTTYEIVTNDPVSGLIADAPVEFHGVEVGRVKLVALDGPRTIRIVLDVKSEAPVTGATVATITARGLAMRGFTGYVYVALEDRGGAEAKPLQALAGQRHPRIPAMPIQVVNMDLAMARVNDNVQALTTLIQGTLDPTTVAALKQSVVSVERVSRTLAANNARLETLLANTDEAMRAMLPVMRSAQPFMRATQDTMGRVDALLDPRTVASLHQLAGSLERVTGMLAANNAKLETLLTKGEEASHEIAPLLKSTRETMDLLQTQVLPEAHRTLAHIDDLSTAMGSVARKVNRDPSVLIRGTTPPPPGPGETQ
jgi:ABC-type transporter Mla subunit MlaD